MAARAGVVLTLTAAGLVATATPSFAVATAVAFTGGQNRIPSGGGFTLGISAAAISGLAAADVQVQFQARNASTPSCNAAAQGPAAIAASASNVVQSGVINVAAATSISGTTATITVPAGLTLPPGVPSADFNVCVYDNTAVSGLGALIGESTTVASTLTVVAPVTTTPSTGPLAGNNTVTVDTAAPIFISGGTYVQFQKFAANSICTATPTSTVNGATIIAPPVNAARVLTDYKLTVGLPAIDPAVLAGDAFHTCVYAGSATGGSGSPLIGSSIYAVGGRYTVNPGATVNSVTPQAGPPQGGQNVVVTGTGFPTDGIALLNITIGGVPLTNVTVSADGQTVRGKTGPHSVGGPYAVTVQTAGGTFISQKGTYTYSNGLTVTPKVAPTGKATATDLDIFGSGFSGMDFSTSNGTDPNSAKAHVYLVRGGYNGAAGSPATVKTNGQTAECLDVLVLSDGELICSIWVLGNNSTPADRAPITGCTAALGATTLTAGAGCTITAADVGSYITGTNLKPGTTISSVAGSAVTLSQGTNAAVAGTDSLIIGIGKPLTGGTFVAGELSGGTGHTFTIADVGKTITGTNILPGTYVTGFNSTTSKVTLSKAPNGTPSAMRLYNTSLIPSGVYTVTVVSNGSIGGQTAAGYSQSIITSGSTFTVADYN